MRALFYTGTQKMEVRDTSAPTPTDDEVMVDISHSGICGSDMHAYHGHDPRRVPPMILGHEAAGVVRGGKLDGKRVVINPLMPCNSCKACNRGDVHLCPNRTMVGMAKPGAYAQSMAVKADNLTVIPDSLDFATAALAEPLACAVHAVRMGLERLATPAQEAGVSVLGGGAIGLLSAMVFADRGVKDLWIAETNPVRRNMLEGAVSARAYDPREKGPEELDLVLDAVGTGRTREAASNLVRPGGMIVHIGLQDNEPGLDTRRMTLQEIGFLGVYCYTPDDFAQAVKMLIDGRVTLGNWTEIRGLEDGPQSFKDIHNGKAPPKIILEMP